MSCSLKENIKIRLVGGQRKHDQVRVQTVDAVRGERVVVALLPLSTDEVHYLVLALARSLRITKNNREVCERGRLAARNPLLYRQRKPDHEGRSWSYHVRVQVLLTVLSRFHTLGCGLELRLESSVEATQPLLIELGSRSWAVDGQIE